MDFYEVAKTRRSVRSYKKDSIPDDVLDRVMETVRISPSGSNRQPWKFILVRENELKRKLISLCGDQQFMTDAPVQIVACGYDIKYNRGHYMGEMSMIVDVTIAFTHLILAARTEGLGTCWIGDFDNRGVKKLLSIPEGCDVVAVTPLGYPKGDLFRDPGPRKAMGEIVSTDRF